MKRIYTKYSVRHIKNDTYLRCSESRYGTSLSLSDFEYAEQYDSFENAKEQILAYCKEKKTMNASMFEVIKLEIAYEEVKSYSLLPTTEEFSCYGWGISTADALQIKEDKVKEMLIKTYKLTPKSFTYRVEVRNEPLYKYAGNENGPRIDIVYIIIDDIVWEVADDNNNNAIVK